MVFLNKYSRYIIFHVIDLRLRLVVCMALLAVSAEAQKNASGQSAGIAEPWPALSVQMKDYLAVFDSAQEVSSCRVTICADVPDNKNPLRPAWNQQTGHVFLTLQKFLVNGDTLQRVFGFYPWRGLPSLFVRKVKSRIRDNSLREYNIAVSYDIDPVRFDSLLAKVRQLQGRPYHLNRYNCYDYAIELFNSIVPPPVLPVTYVRFPFPFGRGGSPCSLYADLSRLREEGGFWSSRITCGSFQAPASTGRAAKHFISFK